jgi:glycosyltransferase involved in cell wall biosynthesis
MVSPSLKVAHLTSAHSRYDTRVFLKECRSLAASGDDVSLVVADGKGSESRDGVHIVDVGKHSTRFDRMTGVVNRVYRAAVALKADVYHLHDPELLRVALKLKSLRRGHTRVVYDAHEEYARQIAIKSYLPSLMRRVAAHVFDRYELYVARRIDGVVVVIDQQMKRFRMVAKRVALVPNYADFSRFPEREVDFSEARIFHGGSLTKDRGLDEMMRLAKHLAGRGSVVLAGRLSPSLSSHDLESVRYVGTLDERQLLEQYLCSNIGLILYRPVGQYGKATAVKAYEYMAASMPIIVPSHGDWPELIARVGCGIAVDIDDVDSQVRAVDWLIANPAEARVMGAKGRRYALEHASWTTAFETLKNLYESITEHDHA